MLDDQLITNEKNIRYRSYTNLQHIIINICLCPFNFGYSNVYFNSISFTDISSIYQIEGDVLSTFQGILTGCLSFAGGFGALCSSYLLAKCTRKQCIQFLSVFMIFISILLMISNVYVLFIARLLQGMCIGMISAVSPLYIRQFTPTELASTLCPLNQVGIVIGTVFSFGFTFVLSLFLPVQVYWRIVFGFPVISSGILLYNMEYKYPYETPKWLLMNGKRQQTKQLLRIIYKEQYVMDVYEQIQKALNSRKIPNEIQLKNINQKQQNKVIELKTNPLAKFSAYFLSICQQLVGMGPIIAYSGQMIGQIYPIMQKIFPIFVNLIALLGAFLTIMILKQLGRKRTLCYGQLIMGILLLILSYCFSNFDFKQKDQNADSYGQTIFICLIFLCIRLVFSFSCGPVTWIYISQTVQPNFISYPTMLNWMTVAIVNTIFPIAKHKLNGNPAYIFIFFGLFTTTSYFIQRVVLIQTQNKNEYQIIKQYDQKWNKLRNWQ